MSNASNAVNFTSLRPVIGVGACLLGHPVRYNGEAKRKNRHLEALRDHCELQNFCPEVAIGLGVPRATVRLVDSGDSVRLTDSKTHQYDYSEAIRDYAAYIVDANPVMAGYIGVKGSPSCGYQRVKRFNEGGRPLASDAQGVFIAELQRLNPLLPIEEDGRLNDAGLRENFLTRVFSYADWMQHVASGISHRMLVEFWSRYKYLVMAHHVESYQSIGRLIANTDKRRIEETAQAFAAMLMRALMYRPSRGSHANVLEHIRGYLKNRLTRDDKAELSELISQYRQGIVPLVVPLTLISHHFKQHHNPYIAQQTFLQPHPKALGLRNIL